jgi:hypothetical protein
VQGARAAIAGVLAAAVVAWTVLPPVDDNTDALRGLGALLAVVALLVGIDVAQWIRNRRR